MEDRRSESYKNYAKSKQPSSSTPPPGSGGGGGGGSGGGDKRAESYQQIAKENAAKRSSGFSYFDTGKVNPETGQPLVGSAAGDVLIRQGPKGGGLDTVRFSQGGRGSIPITPTGTTAQQISGSTPPQTGLKPNITIPVSPGVASKIDQKQSYFYGSQNRYYVTYTNPLNNPVQFQKDISNQQFLNRYRTLTYEPWVPNWKTNPVQFGAGVISGGLNTVEDIGGSLIKGTTTLFQTAPGALAYNLPVQLRAGVKPVNPMTIARNPDVRNVAVAGGLILASEYSLPRAVIETSFATYGIYKIGKGISAGNPYEIGEGSVYTALSNPLSVFARIKRPFVELAGEKIKPEDVFSDQVTAKSVGESLRKFGGGRKGPGQIEIVTVSPGFLKGDVIQAGPKGLAGVEDPVGYFAPSGSGNVMFTGLPGYGASSEISINPLDLFSSRQPTANLFTVSEVARIPRNVLKEPGFANPKLKTFYEANLGTGTAFITKRSELGIGGLQRQYFQPVADIQLRGKTFKAGEYYLEAGTSEAEAGLYQGTTYRRVDTGLKQRFRYTVLNQKTLFGLDVPLTGELVRVPKYEVLKTSFSRQGLKTDDFFNQKDFLPENASTSSRPSYKIPARGFSFRSSKASGSSRVSQAVNSLSLSSNSVSYSVVSYPGSFKSFKSTKSSLVGSRSLVSRTSASGLVRSLGSQSSLSRSLTSGRSGSRSLKTTSTTTTRLFSFKGAGFREARAKRRFGVVKPVKYVPSFSALAFNIRGSYKPGRLGKSGLNFRPITPGFRFDNAGLTTRMGVAL